MANSKVPKFGEWENADNVGYTVCFDNTRKGKSSGTSPTPNEIPMPRNEDMQKQSSTTRRGTKSSKVPKFGDWNEEASYTAVFDNTTRKDSKSSEPQMNRDVRPGEPVVLSRRENSSTRSNNDTRGNGVRDTRGNSGRDGRTRVGVQFAGVDEGSTGSGRGDNLQKRGAAATRPYAGRGPSVPQFGNWNGPEAENYTVVFNNIKDSRKTESDPSDIRTPGHRPPPPPQEKEPRKFGFCSCF